MTIEEIFELIDKDDDLGKEAMSIRFDDEKILAFLKRFNCDATLDEAKAYAKQYIRKYSMGDIELYNISSAAGGGFCSEPIVMTSNVHIVCKKCGRDERTYLKSWSEPFLCKCGAVASIEKIQKEKKFRW